MQVFTKSADRFPADGVRYGGELFGRYATAEDSPAARGEIQVGITREGGLHTGFLVGGDARSFGDIEGGRATGLQPNTAHDETGFDFKVEHWLAKDTKLVLLHQQYAQTDVPRTHATVFGESYAGTAVGTDLRRDLDQNRRLTYLQLHRTGLEGAVQAMRFSVSWQTQRELEDRQPPTGAARYQAFEVGTFGTFAQFDSDLGRLGTLTYGVDYYRDNVNSWFRRASGAQASDPIQGQVANDASYDLLGVFVQDDVAVTDRLGLTAGVRYTYGRGRCRQRARPERQQDRAGRRLGRVRRQPAPALSPGHRLERLRRRQSGLPRTEPQRPVAVRHRAQRRTRGADAGAR